MKEKQYKKLSKYLKGTAKVLVVLANEIEQAKTLDKESEDLMCKVGSNILFNAKTYNLLDKSHNIGIKKSGSPTS